MPSPTAPTRRVITPDDIAPLASGTAIFGTGGGGSVHTARLAVEAALLDHGPVELVGVDDLDADDTVLLMSGIGAPSVGVELLPSADQPRRLLEQAERWGGRRITALMAAEIGGSNGLGPVGWAAQLGLKVLDADGMGRAFPYGDMVAMNVAGVPCAYSVMADAAGNVTVLENPDLPWLERMARALVIASGGISLAAHYPLTADTARGAVIDGTISRSIEVGRALRAAEDPVAAAAEVLGAAVVIEGKLVDVERRFDGGFTRGSAVIEGTGPHRGRVLRAEIQNENLIVFEGDEVVATVPDLITILDTATGEAISTELLRFGQRVSLLVWACHPLWRTPRGLELAGPARFGYDIDYAPFERSEAAR